eukprot:224100_1
MVLTIAWFSFSFSIIWLAITAYSCNLLCKPDIWTITSYTSDSSAMFHPNHTMCTISTVHTIPTESTHLAMLKDINYVFSNPSHYPLNFTTRAIPFGNAPMVKIMILFYTNVNSGWGLSETTNRPTTLTYEWLSIDSTSFTMYIDGVASHFRSMTNNNRASN